MPVQAVQVRRANPGERRSAMELFDAALLAFDRELLRNPGESVDVLVASEHGRIRGAILLDSGHIEAIAVRPRHRHRGIGRALIERADAHHETLTAEGRNAVRPFFEAVGVRIDSIDDERWVGRLG